MKTTELWIEQVLIGGLGMTVALLPWLPEVLAREPRVDFLAGLAGGSLALGLAFWLGIPLDRLADTLSERLDRHARLRFALTRARGRPLPQADARGRLDRDVGPEDRLRIAGLRDSEAAVSWIDYHRSRIRLTRAMALYGPALTITLVAGVERMRPDRSPVNLTVLAGILAAYVLWALLVRLSPALPRTDEAGLIRYATEWGFVDPGTARVTRTATSDISVWGAEWVSLAVPTALLAVALVQAGSSAAPWARLAAVAGAAVTVISAWAWWRIGFTFRTYLYELDRYGERPPR